ncbi:MAG: ATP/GTP-binding protein [Promethearchaeota archaeon]
MIINSEKKTICIKIVYYGPAMSGKTTSLRFLFSHFGKEHLIESIENSVGRTLFFDFGTLTFKGNDWDIKFLLYSATGQDFYASTRTAILKGVDGIIFVVDGHIEFKNRNKRSWAELEDFFGWNIYSIPIIIALNKYDLKEVQAVNHNVLIDFINFKTFKNIHINKTSAISGYGILESFQKIVTSLFPQIEFSIL